MNTKFNYAGTAHIVKDVCGNLGLKLIKGDDYAVDCIDMEQYRRDLARLKSMAVDEKRLIQGSTIEKIIYKFFGMEAKEGLNTRLDGAKQILGELEIMTEKYANYEKELTDSYFKKRKKVLDAAQNVKSYETIIDKLESEKQSVFPKPKIVGIAGSSGTQCSAVADDKWEKVELDRKFEEIDRDISVCRDSSIASALVSKYTKQEVERLDEYRQHVRFIVDNTRRTIICGGMFIDHVDECKKYLIDGEEVLTTNMEFQKALFEIKESMDYVIKNVDDKMEIFGVYMGMNPFKSLFSDRKRKKLRLKEYNRENDEELIREALMELEEGGDGECIQEE